jgi:xanthine dehydrogenase YagT iron-sulfur-binding subunit
MEINAYGGGFCAGDQKRGLTRREFMAAIGVVTGGLALGFPAHDVATAAPESSPAHLVAVSLTVNGKPHDLKLDPRVTLLDLLREDLGLPGTKKGCDHGQCGACTILVNGRRINSCLALAVAHDGDEITTVEGLKQNEDLNPVQAAFIEHDGFQCGYCTPGQICSAVALLAEAKRGDASFVSADLSPSAPAELTDDEIRERMSGNICRCGAYPGILAAVKASMGTAPPPPTGRKEGRS